MRLPAGTGQRHGFEVYANAARRDGYLTDAVRLRMVLACLMFSSHPTAP